MRRPSSRASRRSKRRSVPTPAAKYYALADRIISAGGVEDLSFGVERDVLAAMLNSLPVELSFVDKDDKVRYFSHENGEKIFPRTRGAIGTAVQNCHPQKSVHLVNQILADFKAGRRKVAEFWIEMGGRFVHIRYFPVRNPKGEYLGHDGGGAGHGANPRPAGRAPAPGGGVVARVFRPARCRRSSRALRASARTPHGAAAPWWGRDRHRAHARNPANASGSVAKMPAPTPAARAAPCEPSVS